MAISPFIRAPFLCPVQLVPGEQVLGSLYHTKDMNSFWFNEQVGNWVNQNDYSQKWMQGDTIQLPIFTYGFSTCTWALYKCSNSQTPVATGNLTNTSSPAVLSPYAWWRASLPISAFNGDYYWVITGGDGTNSKYLISERQNIKADQPNTLLWEYTSSSNKQGMIFEDGAIYSFRLEGFFDNTYQPKYKGASYVDQLQDISIINAILYGTDELFVGSGTEGIPDWAIQKTAGIMLLDKVNIEGIGRALDEGAEWEPVKTIGAPKKYWKTNIRRAENIDGINASLDNSTEDPIMIATVDALATSPNFNNVGGNNEPDIIQIITSN